MSVGDLVSLRMRKTVPPEPPQTAIVLGLRRGSSGHVVGVTVMWEHGNISTLATPDFLEVINDNTILD
tara:strand:+ start:1026 stop:1229 length:204 start_codon:yes stop_codon:yes gene_type:complete